MTGDRVFQLAKLFAWFGLISILVVIVTEA
jgi:hypothetical protein